MNTFKLLFVYNADGGLFSTVTDFARKLLAPSTYPCQLCALTYGNFSMKRDWKHFIVQLPMESRFLHKDEFLKQYKTDAALPAVFISGGAGLEEIVSRTDIQNCSSVEELKKLILEKLSAYDQRDHSHL